ncbi:MAG: DNA internalization-related competence protein ComEC/Rec2 [Pseudomonadota bacterium]
MCLTLVTLRFSLWAQAAGDDIAPCAKSPQLARVQVLEVRGQQTRQSLFVRVHEAPACGALAGVKLRLGWYVDADAGRMPAAGDVLQVEIKIRRPWGTLNPGGFNYRLWLLSQGFYATGYVRKVVWQEAPIPRRVAPSLLYPELLRAIAIGDRSGISAEQWELFRASGTIHLMVVSGLHVGLFAGIWVTGFTLLGRALNLVFVQLWPAHLGLLSGTVAAFVYASYTGLAAPVIRASLMVGIACLAMLLLRRNTALKGLLCAAGAIALVQPNMLLQQGFWLSFTAVFCLLWWFAPRWRRASAVVCLLQIQWITWLGMTPWLGILVGAVPISTPLNNLLAVPLMTLCGIPAAMLGFLLDTLGWSANPALILADYAVHILVQGLAQAPQADFGFFDRLGAGIAFVLFIGWTVPVQWRQRCGLAVLWLGVLVRSKYEVLPGEFQVDVLDVGQGDAILVKTERHVLLVDTGPSFAGGFDSGAATVIPALRKMHIRNLDKILITHFDRDHFGGLASVQARYPQAPVVSPRKGCESGSAWHWDGVDFVLLRVPYARSRNAGSCTLLIGNGKRQVYLPGDIDSQSELQLLKYLPQWIDLTLAPHHGSSSSSHVAFVQRLAPRWVVVSAGYANRYGHPHSDVISRYEGVDSQILLTAEHGAIRWRSRDNSVAVMRAKILGVAWPWRNQIPPITRSPERVEEN